MLMRVERPIDRDDPRAPGANRDRGLYSLVRVGFDGDGWITSVRDYLHVPAYLFEMAGRDLDLAAAPFHWSHIPNPARAELN